MPRKKKTVTTTVEDEPRSLLEDEDIEPQPYADPEMVDGLDDLLQKFSGSKFKLKIYKQPLRGSEQYCFQTDETLDEDALRDGFGGGKYLVRIWANGSYADTAVIHIAEPITTPSAVQNGSQDTRMYEMMRTHNDQLQSMLLAFINKEATVSNGNGTGIKELIESVVALNGLTATKDPVNMLLEGIKLAKDMNGESDWKSDLISVAKDVGKPLMTELLKGKLTQPSVPRTTIPEGPLPTEAVLKSGIGFLKSQCKFMTPELAIDWVTANSSHEEYQHFVRFALLNDFESFAKIDPEITTEPYNTWFKTLHKGIHDTFATETNGQDTQYIEGETRNDPNITTDEVRGEESDPGTEASTISKSA